MRCNSLLVEKTSFEQEQEGVPPPPEVNRETPAFQETSDKKEELSSTLFFDFEEENFPPAPTLKVEKREPETKPTVKKEKNLYEVTPDGQSSSGIFPRETKKEINHSGKIEIRIPSLSYRNVSIIILILIGGYLVWSIYSSYVSPKQPDTMASPSTETISHLPSGPTASTGPMKPPMEPKIVDHNKLEKETAVFPTTIKTPASLDGKEIENIKNLFENIRQANLKKNIDLFMSCYSAGFKDQEEKKRETLKNWEHFTYINLSYNLKEQTISGDTAGIRVEWFIRFYHQAGNQPQESRTVLDVTLNRESDGWKIKNIKTIG
jgi:hypothetical protein